MPPARTNRKSQASNSMRRAFASTIPKGGKYKLCREKAKTKKIQTTGNERGGHRVVG